MSDEIWVAVIATIGVIGVPTINHLAQLRKSRRAGVTSEDVQAQPAAVPPDPVEGWDRLVRRLEEQVSRLVEQQKKSDRRISRIEDEIEAERDLRWTAIQHIRALYAWITKHIPGVDPPAVPEDLAPYIIINRKDPS